MIHQHCFDDGGGIIELELQIAANAIMFRDGGVSDGYNSLLNVMSQSTATKMIAQYGWKQRTWKSRKYVHTVEDMKVDKYHTVYIKTSAGGYGPLVATCNHPHVSRINMSAVCRDSGNGKYVLGYTQQDKND